MKSKLFKTSIILIAFASLGFITVDNDSAVEKNQVIMSSILHYIDTYHYSPLDLDDSLSVKVYDKFLQYLDYSKRYLLKEDVEQLEKYRYKIDNQLKNVSLEFFHVAVDKINKRLKNVEGFYEEILDEPFDYTKNDEITIDPEHRDFFTTEQELKEYWTKLLKYEAMVRLADQIKVQEKAKENKDTVVEEKSYEEMEKDVREQLKKKYKNFFHRMDQYDADDRFADYMNAISGVYDPHTSYFPPKDKEDFDIDMSGKLEGIGALLSQRDEYIKVENILPGSPSQKQGELEAGDIILKVAQGLEEPVDVVDMRLDKAVRLIRGKKGTEVRLTVKKLDGTIKIIPIIRDVVYKEETFAKSVILQDETIGKKFGYINLPSFYVDFNSRFGKRSSTDMRAELEKLKKENIEGLILDLRQNGGGSLQDAVDIAGLFIKSGPVVQVNSKFGIPQILRDYDPGIEYGGPMIVLVSSSSASASEILSAALQDYGRAIIVGDSSSYGKGTVQRFFDLDETVPMQYKDLTPLGSLKMTIQKFYRINGGATQLKGVTPDIILPSNYAKFDFGEKELDYAMPWDEIKNATYNTTSDLSDNVKFLKERTAERLAKDSIFMLIDENAVRLKALRDDHTYTLNLDKFRKEVKEREEQGKKFERIGKDTFDIKISNLKDDMPLIMSDSLKMASNDNWFKSIKKDYYLRESMNILKDLIVSYQAGMN